MALGYLDIDDGLVTEGLKAYSVIETGKVNHRQNLQVTVLLFVVVEYLLLIYILYLFL